MGIRYLGELVGRDDGLDVVDPGGEVPEVGEEPVQEVALVQLLLAQPRLLHQLLPVRHDLAVLSL